MKRPFSRSTGLALASVVTLAAMLAATLFSLSVVRTAQHWTNHTIQVRFALAQVRSNILDSEMGQRGFLLARAPESLALYENARRLTRDSLNAVGDLITDNPIQLANLAGLRALVEVRQREQDRTIQALKGGDAAQALSLARANAGQGTADAIRVRLDRMDGEEVELLAVRSALTSRRYHQALGVMALSGLLLMGLGWQVLRIDRDLRRRADLELSLTAALHGEKTARRDAETAQWEAKQAALAQARLASQASMAAEAAIAMTESGPLSVLLRHSCQAAVKHLDAALIGIWTVSPGGTYLELQASAGIDAGGIDVGIGRHRRVAIGQREVGKVAAERKPYLTNELAGDPHAADQDWARREGLSAFAGHPLLVEGRLVGVIALFARQPVPRDALETLASVANTVGVGIERKRSESERERLIGALERSNQELDQFAYVASHDLKAPLRGIANLSRWIEEDLAERMTDESRQHLELLRGRAHRMEALIDGILDYSRAGRVAEKTDEVDVGQLIGEVVSLLAPPGGVRIEIGSGMPTLHAERVPLQQMFLNLIGNALKHARRSDATIKVGVADAGRFFDFQVADDGPGIAPEFHGRIWGIFQTLEARDKVEGTGIGLSIVKKLAEARGGKVWVDSQPGQGATFHFLWPKNHVAEV